MSFLRSALLLWMLGTVTGVIVATSSSVVLDEGQWAPRAWSRCMPIPQSMALCQGLGYRSMRLPNLLGHETAGEAVQQSSSWLPLLARQCHPHARNFLCSLFAPICLDRVIHPCRSLCEAVRDSCAPIMHCYGYPWPRILQCDQFPKDHMMCISSVTPANGTGSGQLAIPPASCKDCEMQEAASSKQLLDIFCRSDFVVKLRLSRVNSSGSAVAKFTLGSRLEVLKHGPLLGGEMRGRLALWLERDATCVGNLSRRHPQGGTFLLTGTVTTNHMLVNKAYSWSKRHRHLTNAARKWKQHRCRG